MAKFRFHIAKARVGNSDVFLVKAVARVSADNVVSGSHYGFPASLQTEENHAELMKVQLIKAAKKNMAKYRNVIVTLSDTVEKLYYNDGNFIFMDEFLDECDDLNQKPPTAESRTSTGSNDTQHMPALPDRIKELELKLERSFAIGEFDGKSDSANYLNKFEAECER